jgi:hypothetical protein
MHDTPRVLNHRQFFRTEGCPQKCDLLTSVLWVQERHDRSQIYLGTFMLAGRQPHGASRNTSAVRSSA